MPLESDNVFLCASFGCLVLALLFAAGSATIPFSVCHVFERTDMGYWPVTSIDRFRLFATNDPLDWTSFARIHI